MNKNYTENLPSFVSLYLDKHFNDKWKIEISLQRKFNNVIVIPAIDEFDNILRLLYSFSENKSKYFEDTLLLFVINNPETCNQKIINENGRTIQYLRSIINKNSNDNLTKRIFDKKINIGIVDASSDGLRLPGKEAGAGMARKIGMDLALHVFDYNNKNKKIIISLDADCILEKNYLDKIIDTFNKNKINAAVIYYEHILPKKEEEKLAIICYELFLRYYVLGLKYANSHFAYHSIGSTIACDAEIYCRAGGMNKRKAGEDFYFLEKIAKITTIHKINDTVVYPSSRISWRVPFGTGQRIYKYLNDKEDKYLLYNPHCFYILKQWLNIFHDNNIKDSQYYLSAAEKINFRLREFLEINSFDTTWNKILLNSKNDQSIQKQKLYWFDAFRTMKLIHYLRDNDFPSINMFGAIDQLLNMMNININFDRKEIIPSTEIQLNYLYYLRNLSKQI